MPTDGIASAASALRYWERRQEVAANNLANATTDGFKGERVFAQLVGSALPVPQAATDFREGAYTPSGNPLDLALKGERQFFVVQGGNGEQWTRGGSWSVDPSGYLVDADGQRALGEHGPIKVEGRDVTIDRTGLVIVDDLKVDRLRIETAPTTEPLQHLAGTKFAPSAGRSAVALDQRDVRQATLEGSNVNTVGSLVDLITIQRNFADAQKALTVLDNVRATITNDLGKVPA